MHIMAQTPPTFKPDLNQSDKVIWAPAVDGRLFVKSAWKAIKTPKSKVPWCAIWFKGYVPRWAFVEWLCRLGRLATKDRLQAWEMEVDPGCMLCIQQAVLNWPVHNLSSAYFKAALLKLTLKVMSLVGTDAVHGRWYIVKLGLMSFLEYFHRNPNELCEE
ncbi:hypothetical protein Acr_20g0006070 [Actinidia rufa]|uniref:Reverse transcriptase zinc-binding domain-containing protein n=1 Tax=Actinidia rufa TaxID=165716 RepID=A0A7J0GDG1_9ERIC|nr:hypothetical protein Acr_20g0006070 [Actinidia rufa]